MYSPLQYLAFLLGWKDVQRSAHRANTNSNQRSANISKDDIAATVSKNSRDFDIYEKGLTRLGQQMEVLRGGL